MSQQGGQEHPDNALIILFFAVLAVFALYYFINKYGYLYSYAFVYFKQYLIIGIDYLPSMVQKIIFFVDFNNVNQAIKEISTFLSSTPNDRLLEYFKDNREKFNEIDNYFGRLFLPYFVIFIIFAMYKILKNVSLTRDFDMEALLLNERALWPQIEIVSKDNPVKVADLDEGKWAMCKSPDQFLYSNDCVIKYVDESGEDRQTLDVKKLRKILEDNIGEEWKGYEELSVYEKEIYCLLVSKAARQPKISQKLNDALALKYSSDRSKKYMPKIREAEKKVEILMNEIENNYFQEDNVLDCINLHFYKKTVFLRLLEEARFDGVLATASFLWLKTKDRTLYYALNNLGRKVGWSEVSGIWGHYLAEKYFGVKKPDKFTDKAIVAFDEFMFLSFENWESIFEHEEV